MKKIYKILITLFIFIGCSFTAYKTVFLEKTLSKIPVPFSLFQENKKINISKDNINIYPIESTQTLKEEFKDITSLFNIEKRDKPNIKSKVLNTDDVNKINDDLNEIYSVPNNFIGKANIIGFEVDNNGVYILLNFAIYQDSKEIKNITYSILNKDNDYSIKKKTTTISDTPFLELPDEYNFDKIIEVNNLINNFFKKDFGLNNSIFKEVRGNVNNITSNIKYIYQDQNVVIERKFGLTKNIEVFKLAIPIDDVKIENLTITK